MKSLVPAILLLASAGCARRGPPPENSWVPAPAPDLGSVVARVGAVPIYSHEVEAQTTRSGNTPREALDDLIALHLLAEKAHRSRPLLPDWFDPELRSALAERLIEREIWPQIQPDDVPDQELRAIYERAIASFVHPRLVDVALLGVFTGPLMKSAARAERAEIAKDLAAHAASIRAHSPADFQAVAADPAWAARNVQYRRIVQGLDQPFSRNFGTEVAKLKTTGDTTTLIESPEGFFLATYAGEQPAENIPFGDVREQLRQRYYERWRALRLEQLARKLAEGHRVESHPQFLNQAAPGRGS